MDDTTFLELPLDRDLYKPKEIPAKQKNPLRILITEASTKTAYNLMYKIASGQVFGPDQEVILHLVSSKGSLDLNLNLGELLACGFSVLVDAVISSEPEKSYKDVDLVVAFAPFEELSGRAQVNSFISQVVKVRHVARNIQAFGRPDTKLVIASPTTKGISVVLTCFTLFGATFPTTSVSGVMCLDATLTKSYIAAHLKVTTDKIKNVVIWGGTHPDISNTTVKMYPPDDVSFLEEKEMLLTEVCQNDKWMRKDLTMAITRRVMDSDLLRHGKAMGSAIATHLQFLFKDTKPDDEIMSMGLIIPENRPYNIYEYLGFSVPVRIKDGNLEIRQDMKYDLKTRLLNIKHAYILKHDYTMLVAFRLLNYIHEYEKATGENFIYSEHEYLSEKIHYKQWFMKHILTASTCGEKEKKSFNPNKTRRYKKSITWEEVRASTRVPFSDIKSFLRFNFQDLNLDKNKSK